MEERKYTDKEIAELRSWVSAAEASLSEAKESLRIAEKSREAEMNALKKAAWEQKELKPFLDSQGKFFTSCVGRQWIWIKNIKDIDKIADSIRDAWPNIDWHKFNPEFEGVEIYYAETAYEEHSFGRWDCANGGTIFIPYLWFTSDGKPGIWEETTREEFVRHWNEYVAQRNTVDTIFNEEIQKA